MATLWGVRYLLAALALVLTACDGTPTALPTIAPLQTTESPSPLPELQPRLDAIGVLLTACIPRLRGEPVDPVDNCANLMPDVAGVIDEVDKKAGGLPAPARTAIADVRKQLGEIAPCESWFAAGGVSADQQLNARCKQAWDGLFKSYTAVRNAA